MSTVFVFYISGHGFGHAARQLEVVKALAAHRPGDRLILRTSVPRWFIEASAPPGVEIQTAEIESGVAQADSLSIDVNDTARRAASFYSTFEDAVDREARLLAEVKASLVVADIPPLAFAAAARSGIPGVAISNFTWDWIYGSYPQFETMAPGVLGIIRDAYATTRCALRLPLHGGFEPMAAVTRDIPLIARKSRAGREATRRTLGLDGHEPVVLASFGGHGLALPLAEVAGLNRFTLLLTEHEDTDDRSNAVDNPRLRRIQGSQLKAHQLDYPDLVAAADIVVSKPGYGIVSECVAQETALLYSSRDGFVEQEVLIREMPQILRCRFLPQEDLRAGRWGDAVDALLRQPPPPRRVATNGAEVAVNEVLKALRES